MKDKSDIETPCNETASNPTGVSLKNKLVVFHCNEGNLVKPAFSDPLLNAGDLSKTAWAYLPCTGRVDMAAVLSSFRKGVSGVLLVGCGAGACRFPGGSEHRCQAEDLVSRAKRVIEMAGLDPDRVACTAGFSDTTESLDTKRSFSNSVAAMLATLAAMEKQPLSLSPVEHGEKPEIFGNPEENMTPSKKGAERGDI